uniref:Uncharacterized protein LOC117361527 isoform X2 n=1 Tax=Geotrypetes seraphini TaxID=260995 RepID=A0A6P8RIX7_GEOSA|nr:uncharacterized protein LOC117361527 isoform X2 [Geotrypetes seraphini]
MESKVFHRDDLEDSNTDDSEDSFYTVYSTNSSDDDQSDTLLNFFKLTSSIKVNQCVDATSDFRDYCTSSKSTCFETSLVSRGNNTEISLLSNYRNKAWQHESSRSVGCNTDTSYIRDVQEVGSQTIWVDAQENPIVADLALVDSTSLIQGSLKMGINEYSIDLKEPADRNFTNEKAELASSLFTSLAELEARYKIMKEKLLRGTPLEALLPLFMEVDMKTSDASYTPSMLSCNSDNSSPVQNISSMVLEGALYQENEKKDVKVVNELKEEFYVHVGSLHPSVSEAEVRTLFQRYDVSEVLIHEYSLKKSFAFLTFKTARQAEMAVEEMDGKQIHGKNIKVRLIRVAREAISSTIGALPSLDHQVIFGKNIEEKVVSNTSPDFSVLPDSNTTDLTIVDFIPNLTTFVNSDPNVSVMALSDLQTGTMSTPNTVHCKATTSCTIANSVLPISPSVSAKTVSNFSLPLSSSLPTISAPNSSLSPNCPQSSWAMHSSCIVPCIVSNTGPASWQMANSYPPSWLVNSSAHRCWWVPCSSQSPWPVPCSSQAPWSMPCTSQTPWPIPCSSQAPWSMPCPSPATWPLSSPIKSPGMLKTIPTVTSKASFSAPQVTSATALSQEMNSTLGSSRAAYTSLASSKAVTIVPAPYFAPSSSMASTEVSVCSSKVTSCVTSQFSTVKVSVPSRKIDSAVSALSKTKGSVFSVPSKAMFSGVSHPSKIKDSAIFSPSKVIGSAVCAPSKATVDLSKGCYSALASFMMTGTSHGSSAPKFIFVQYEYQSFEEDPIQLRPVTRIPNVCGIYKSQNYMMVNNFCKLMKKMTKLHPTAGRCTEDGKQTLKKIKLLASGDKGLQK